MTIGKSLNTLLDWRLTLLNPFCNSLTCESVNDDDTTDRNLYNGSDTFRDLSVRINKIIQKHI